MGGTMTYLDLKLICLNKISMRALHGRSLTITCICTAPQSSLNNAVTSYSRYNDTKTFLYIQRYVCICSAPQGSLNSAGTSYSRYYMRMYLCMYKYLYICILYICICSGL